MCVHRVLWNLRAEPWRTSKCSINHSGRQSSKQNAKSLAVLSWEPLFQWILTRWHVSPAGERPIKTHLASLERLGLGSNRYRVWLSPEANGARSSSFEGCCRLSLSNVCQVSGAHLGRPWLRLPCSRARCQSPPRGRRCCRGSEGLGRDAGSDKRVDGGDVFCSLVSLLAVIVWLCFITRQGLWKDESMTWFSGCKSTSVHIQ